MEERFFKTGMLVLQIRSVQFIRELIQWVDTAFYLGATLDKRLSWLTYRAREKESG
jgi:hypothetical protein